MAPGLGGRAPIAPSDGPAGRLAGPPSAGAAARGEDPLGPSGRVAVHAGLRTPAGVIMAPTAEPVRARPQQQGMALHPAPNAIRWVRTPAAKVALAPVPALPSLLLRATVRRRAAMRAALGPAIAANPPPAELGATINKVGQEGRAAINVTPFAPAGTASGGAPSPAPTASVAARGAPLVVALVAVALWDEAPIARLLDAGPRRGDAP